MAPNHGITVRPFQVEDAPEIAQLFHDTIHRINAADYSPTQLQAWAPADINFENWAARCSRLTTFVAVTNPPPEPELPPKSTVVGFAELEPTGQIRCFYCHWAYQRQGIGRALYQALETQANQWQLPTLKADVSITARPFFTRLGFQLVREQQAFCRGAWLTNFQMIKSLWPGVGMAK